MFPTFQEEASGGLPKGSFSFLSVGEFGEEDHDTPAVSLRVERLVPATVTLAASPLWPLAPSTNSCESTCFHFDGQR